jgi:hypothetical protein
MLPLLAEALAHPNAGKAALVNSIPSESQRRFYGKEQECTQQRLLLA